MLTTAYMHYKLTLVIEGERGNKRMIRVGVIGAGYIGRVHLEQLVRLGGVEVDTIVDSNINLAKEAAQKYGVKNYSDNWKAVVDDPSIDVIHNCTPNKFHFEINKQALLNKKHILSEKPLAMTLEEAKELSELPVKMDAGTGVDFCYRYYPVSIKRKQKTEWGYLHAQKNKEL